MNSNCNGPIASRDYETQFGDRVRVTLGCPYRESEGGDFWCDYAIDGLGTSISHKVAGIDGVQAILLAMYSAAAHLVVANEKGHGVSWVGSKTGDELGLPIPGVLER